MADLLLKAISSRQATSLGNSFSFSIIDQRYVKTHFVLVFIYRSSDFLINLTLNLNSS